MPQLTLPAIDGVHPAHDMEVYINGKRMRSVIVSSITDEAGIEANKLTLLFPTYKYRAHPCSADDRVIVYVDRRYRTNPMFRGYITGFGDFHTIDSGQYVEVYALDDAYLLTTVVCERSYNAKDTRDELLEDLTIREIASEISRQARAGLGSEAPDILTNTFPADHPGEMNVVGQPLDQALSQLLDMAGDYKYLFRREYTDIGTTIRAFRVGAGEVATITYATDLTKSPDNQPYGRARAGVVRREEQTVDVVNKGVVIGERQILETALPLAKNWNAAKETYLQNLESYTKKGSDDDPNPDYDPEAELIGRSFAISRANTGYVDNSSLDYAVEYPELEPRLLVASPYNNGNADDKWQPFVVYKFGSEATLHACFDISISDNIVKTEKPLVRDNTASGGVITPELPSYAWVECAVKLRTPFRINIAKQGGVSRSVTRYFTKTDFSYKYQDDYFSITRTGEHTNATLSQTVPDYTITANTTPNVIVNDTTDATAWGIARLRATRDTKLEITYEIPYLDLSYKVGQVVKENNQLLNANLFRIEYDLVAYKTMLQAVSR